MSLLKVAGTTASSGTLYVDDVFSVYLYTGNGSTQTITNGIDLAGQGGMVWIKSRSDATDNALYDTARGATYDLVSNSGNVQTTQTTGLTTFNSNGFSIGALAKLNTSASTYASWTFRKAPKFFDVVTWTGNNVNGRQIPHNLGTIPGCIMVKYTSPSGAIDWAVYHVGIDATSPQSWVLALNTTAARTTPDPWNNTAPTSTNFTISNAAKVNASGSTYVAYLFAHDTSSTGIIQCGSYTTDASAIGTNVNLGWQPQLVLVKSASSTSQWNIMDTMRGFTASDDNYLYPNLANAEVSGGPIAVNATGFKDGGQIAVSSTIIYMAIRMPNKPPTTGTQVFSPVARTGTDASYTVNAGFVVDLNITDPRNKVAETTAPFADRLRGYKTGAVPYIIPSSTSAEATDTGGGIYEGTQNGVYLYNTIYNNSSTTYVNWMFRRAPGFFDEVCYTGTGAYATWSHNLTVAPEMIIIKDRTTNGRNWPVYCNLIYPNGTTLDSNNPVNTANNGISSVSTTTFTTNANSNVAALNDNFVAYLFATLAGISKVGSYTGNGTGQAIACGFGSGGARFVLIRRISTSVGGDWYTFDSARGLTSGSSPYLLLNSAVAEVPGNNGVYASSGGFTLGATAITTTNIATATYIYLSVA